MTDPFQLDVVVGAVSPKEHLARPEGQHGLSVGLVLDLKDKDRMGTSVTALNRLPTIFTNPDPVHSQLSFTWAFLTGAISTFDSPVRCSLNSLGIDSG